MYIGRRSENKLGPGGRDHGDWHTEFIEIPPMTPEDKVSEVAIAMMSAKLEHEGAERVAFVGVYNAHPTGERDTRKASGRDK